MSGAATHAATALITHHPDRRGVRLHLNGAPVTIEVEPRRSLADVLRDELGLTGTHLGCEQGVCGSCTVLLDAEPVRACLMLAVQADGRSVRTVEALTGDGGALHPLQEAFRECHALQCGFCTPGFLMLLAGTLEADPRASDDKLAAVVSSNLCRCTGYTPILEAARLARDRGLPPPPPRPADPVPTPSPVAAAADVAPVPVAVPIQRQVHASSRVSRARWLAAAAAIVGAAVAAAGLRRRRGRA